MSECVCNDCEIFTNPWKVMARENPGECWCYFNGATEDGIPWCDIHRCRSLTREGTRCKHRTARGDTCNQHFSIAMRKLAAIANA